MFIVNDRSIDPAAEVAPEAARLADPEAHRIALHLTDTAAMLATILHLRDAGAGVFPIHPDMPAELARAMAGRAGCDLFLGDDGVETLPGAATPVAGRLVHLSSGTTGHPKVIARPWESIETEIASYVAGFTVPDGMTPVIACPITHSYGLIPGVMVGQRRGQVPVVLDTLNPKYILRRLAEIEAPVLYTSPAMLHTLACLTPPDRPIHAAMTSGTTLPQSWFQRIRARTGQLFQQYGCSEAGCIAINPALEAASEIGYPLPHFDVAAGDAAEDPAEIVAETPTPDGPLRIASSDLGWRRKDGMLVFVARMDDMINVAGLNVYPQEVEQTALSLTGVEDALAFRIEDALAGARVGLIYQGGEVEPDALRGWCRERLAGFQQPAMVRRVEAIPRQANGKVNRREVSARFTRAAEAVAVDL